MTDRYDTSNQSEGQFEPGPNERVLKNRLGVIDPNRMEELEFDRLDTSQQRLFREIATDQGLTAEDLCQWHQHWLGDLYDWAGRYRTVNMTKGDFLFAAAHRIPSLMQHYDRDYLQTYTPCEGMDDDSLCDALAICHVELIIIHPFREGNGRLARLLSTIMALQAGAPLLDFTAIERNKPGYIEAVHAGHGGDYAPMKAIFSTVLAQSRR